MENLFRKLKENRDSGRYPCHMPGHKRRACGDLTEELCGLDITETDGFDNLHQPQEILLSLQQEAARLYGAEESFFLVNGSTAGILAAVSASLERGRRILMARNCHRSAYHAAYLRGLDIAYLYPAMLSEFDIFDAVTPRQVEEALEQDPEIGAVLLVSPTYEGRISDVASIAEIVHAKGIPLIVDEAHGAHLGFGSGLPGNSCAAGADLVIHSVHKTLPSLTQTALLHVNGERTDREKLRRFLRIYQTSSPSYLLMASIGNVLRFLETDGERAFGVFTQLYAEMMDRLKGCQHLKILPWERESGSAGSRQDIGKLLISVKETGWTGRKLYDLLLQQYALQPEMAGESYVLAMFTVNDSPEGYRRMTQALLEIDKDPWLETMGREYAGRKEILDFSEKPTSRIPLAKAWDMAGELVELSRSVGRDAGEFVNLYPPGVPVLVPGEQITENMCIRIRSWLDSGLTVQGVERKAGNIYIRVIT